ncbi:helix-turn-helix transcriptional regulator [Winogradskya consettensis]|uniref:Transcriptional regulator n=1 Tax=Winogradskya consettensis TaxID=113560 RepID=A0A919W0G6_9ACTN|nr:helix-turn-helix transcriptional regulator [Actinoplanes consettensis]GIM81644.1 transcriptional regulator [Actinoplanes consettensis]
MGPTVARERLRLRLRELRDSSGLSTDTVATRMDWSPSKLSRIEKGDVTVQPLEVRALLALYGLRDEAEVVALASLARRSRTRQWYSKHRLNGDYQRFVAYENEASTINIWQMLFVPGLLQTPGYAQAITSISIREDPASENVQARVDLRLDRQRAFQERLLQPAPPRIVAVIDESTLRRPVGGRAVLAGQLDHLLTLARENAYTLAVTPIELDRHPGLGGTFELLEFAGTADPDVLFVEAAASTDDLSLDQELTAVYGEIMRELLTVGLTGDAALDLIRGIRAGLS